MVNQKLVLSRGPHPETRMSLSALVNGMVEKVRAAFRSIAPVDGGVVSSTNHIKLDVLGENLPKEVRGAMAHALSINPHMSDRELLSLRKILVKFI